MHQKIQIVPIFYLAKLLIMWFFIKLSFRAQCNRTFCPKFLNIRNKLVCVHGSTFQPTQMFEGKARAHPSEAPILLQELSPQTTDQNDI